MQLVRDMPVGERTLTVRVSRKIYDGRESCDLTINLDAFPDVYRGAARQALSLVPVLQQQQEF